MSCIWMINESPLTDNASIFEGRFGLGAAVGPDMTNGGLGMEMTTGTKSGKQTFAALLSRRP
ncbi:MAG: hypothetical protein P8H92_06110 [Paracoccaceae bacterium]|nr:hypothetical protein [Paracoccaceae bacterium]